MLTLLSLTILAIGRDILFHETNNIAIDRFHESVSLNALSQASDRFYSGLALLLFTVGLPHPLYFSNKSFHFPGKAIDFVTKRAGIYPKVLI
jgi:hypothetical protein